MMSILIDISNRSISPIYQSIRTLSEGGVPDGDPTCSLFERSLAFWEQLRLVYLDVETLDKRNKWV